MGGCGTRPREARAQTVLSESSQFKSSTEAAQRGVKPQIPRLAWLATPFIKGVSIQPPLIKGGWGDFQMPRGSQAKVSIRPGRVCTTMREAGMETGPSLS